MYEHFVSVKFAGVPDDGLPPRGPAARWPLIPAGACGGLAVDAWRRFAGKRASWLCHGIVSHLSHVSFVRFLSGKIM